MTTTYKEIAKSGAKFGKSEGCVRITAFALLRVPNDFHGVRWCILCEYFVHDGICLYFSVVNRSFFLSLYTDDGMWHADGNMRSGIKQTNCMLLRIPRVDIPQRFEIQRNFHIVKRQ